MNEISKHHGPRFSVSKYRFKSVGPEDFKQLRRASGVSIRDFMFMTGRHSNTVAMFHGEGTLKGTTLQAPTMGDVMILEIIKRYPEMHDAMIAIANDYSTGPSLTGK